MPYRVELTDEQQEKLKELQERIATTANLPLIRHPDHQTALDELEVFLLEVADTDDETPVVQLEPGHKAVIVSRVERRPEKPAPKPVVEKKAVAVAVAGKEPPSGTGND